MMKQSLFFTLAFLISCREQQPQVPVDFSQEEVVIEEGMTPAVSSFNKRNRLPLINVLYLDAKRRDSRLAELDESIVDMAKVSADSLRDFRLYQDYNKRFYRSANDYLSKIQDTTARAVVRDVLQKSEVTFAKDMSVYNDAEKSIATLRTQLSDQHMMMQILVSESMIRAYQQNQPSLETLEALENEYRDLIAEAEAYSKYHKEN